VFFLNSARKKLILGQVSPLWRVHPERYPPPPVSPLLFWTVVGLLILKSYLLFFVTGISTDIENFYDFRFYRLFNCKSFCHRHVTLVRAVETVFLSFVSCSPHTYKICSGKNNS